MENLTSQNNAPPQDLISRAENGNVTAQTALGEHYLKTHDYKKAFKWYSKAALKGNADAQYHLGLIYQEGSALAHDYDKAAHWFFMAATQSHAGAQYSLGMMYHVGDGVPQDYIKAFTWYSKAAEQGNATAQFKLGLMYHVGCGVPQDNVLRYMWFNLAVAHGNADAIKFKDITAKAMTPAQMDKAKKKSMEWLSAHS